MGRRSTLLLAPVLVAGSMISVAAAAGGDVPSGASAVHVTSGSMTQNIDAHLKNAAGIKGTVRNAAGKLIPGAQVTVFGNDGYVTAATANASGVYTIGSLLAGTYKVCATGPYFGGPVTGYVGSCYGGGYFGGYFFGQPVAGKIPSAASPITLSNGELETGKHIRVRLGAAISGKVRTPSGALWTYAQVRAHNRSTGITVSSNTDKTGTYKVKSLPASAKGYTVCVAPRLPNQPDRDLPGKTGLAPRCYQTTAWNGSGWYPAKATKVSVHRGRTTTGISVKLTRAGAISGTVTNARTGEPMPAAIGVFSATGRLLTIADTNSKGHYVAEGLPAARGDRVCVYPGRISVTVHFKGKCWKNVAWSGGRPPNGTTGVRVRLGKIHTGISFKLTTIRTMVGSITGTIREAAAGQPLEEAEVQVFTAGGVKLTDTTTRSDGTYNAPFLPVSSTGYVVCARMDPFTTTISTTPTPDPGGWAARCYNTTGGAAWNQSDVPSDATKLPIGAGQRRSGIDIALPVGGEISGDLFIGAGPATAAGIDVYLFTAGGEKITTETWHESDTYSLTGLAPKFGYKVCFDGRYGGPSQRGFRPQCYDSVEWNGTT